MLRDKDGKTCLEGVTRVPGSWAWSSRKSQELKLPLGMDSALTFTETPSVPADPLKWKYLLAGRAGGAFPGVPAQVGSAVVTFSSLWGFLCSGSEWSSHSRGSAPFGRAAVPKQSFPLTKFQGGADIGVFFSSSLKKSLYKISVSENQVCH